MDIEIEKILDLLFRNGISVSWRASSDFYNYFARIGGYDVDMLTKEPNHLVDEINLLQLSTQNLLFSNYKIFICAAKNSREIFKDFNYIERKLDKLLGNIPEFIDKCNSFCNIINKINSRKRLNSLTLSKNIEVQEILELPQLMETCLENNQYCEALELSQYARLLSTRHEDIQIITNIVNKIENSWSTMVNQIVDLLKLDLPLPRCLQLIGLLRSMNAFTESELRIIFIEARDIWLQALLKSVSSTDCNSYMLKTIELSRINLFNVIMQYKALFNDDHYLVLEGETIINDSALFYQWLEEKMLQFLETLKKNLCIVSSIDAILGQCKYFGLSFGRVGTDFTGRMSHIFIKRIRSKFEYSILRSTKSFEMNLESFIFIYKFQNSKKIIESVINSENPPEKLVDYYPLAEYCNSLTEAFNELRLNIPIILVQSFTSLLQNSLHSVAETMFSYYKKWQKNFTPRDKENMVQFINCFKEQLIPYIQYCIHALFPLNQLSIFLNVSISQLQKEEISYLNKKFIVEPVKSLLPIKSASINAFLPQASSSNDSLDFNPNNSSKLNYESIEESSTEESTSNVQVQTA